MARPTPTARRAQGLITSAVRFAGARLLGDGAVPPAFRSGLSLGGVVAGLRADGPVVASAVLLPAVDAGATT